MLFACFVVKKCMLSYLIPGITYGFAAAVSPGPLSMYLMSQAVSAGWRRALPAAFSPLISDGPVCILVLTILSRAPLSFMPYMRLLGGAFIIYLAFGAWRSWREFDSSGAAPVRSGSKNLLKAAVVNWLNPNLYVGWGVILGPMVLSGWRQAPAKGVALIIGFYTAIIATMIVMVILFAAAGAIGRKVRKNLIGISSLALAGLGLYQLWLGVSGLIAY